MLRSIAPNIVNEDTDWYSDKVIWYGGELEKEFWHVNTVTKLINPNKIIGSTHLLSCSNQISWLNYLESLPRMNSFLKMDLNQLINFITCGKENHKTCIEINNKYFITSGNHRLTLAKFLNIESVNMEVLIYKHKNEKKLFYFENFYL
ncbi:hypothetical protein [Phocaeicola sartorii]|nr:hypothetical protein [Phocaeicola sartorii]